MSMKWFRMYSEFATDPKVQMMSEAYQRRYIMLLCLRCGNDNVTFHDDEIAFQLRVTDEEWAETKAVFIEKGLITQDLQIVETDYLFSLDRARPVASEWRAIRSRIFQRDNYTCVYCGAHGVRLECDHIVPVSRGGGSDDSNLATACFDCNRSKGGKLLLEWRGDNE